MVQRKFDRLRSFDSRSWNYPIRTLVRGLTPKSNVWPISKVLDQGQEGSCVGHGCAHELIAEPVPCPNITHENAVSFYKFAQTIDEWPGEDYEGTSVLAGLNTLKKHGWCDEFRWAFTLDDIILCIGYEGPMVMGTNWYTGMLDTDSNGFVHVTGQNEGGHCWLMNGVNIEQRYFQATNSWGYGWGQNGTFKLSFDDAQKLMNNQGEAGILIVRHDNGTIPGDIPPEPDKPCIFGRSFAGIGNFFAWASGRKSRLKVYTERR